ncbi:hypothetical protein AgCh_005004 [Apium graveolens]
MPRFIGNLDLCGRQVNKPCHTSLGFPVILPHTESDEVAAVPNKRPSHYVKGALIGAVSTVCVAILLVLAIFLWVRLQSKKERDAKKYKEVYKQSRKVTGTKLINFHGDLPYPSCEIIEKNESLREEDIAAQEDMALSIGWLFTAKLLIYDYMAMGSLDEILYEHGEDRSLNWNARLRIALGSARGLAYLRHDCCPRIIHRDIKSSNILLHENLDPRVSDFGLAKLLVDDSSHTTPVVAGTFGYLAPENLQSGMVTEKSDVYSFGVLLLELVTGRRPTDPTFVKHGLNVVGWNELHNQAS